VDHRGRDLCVHTWQGEQWKIGGGTVWGWISYDPTLDLIYYGTANPPMERRHLTANRPNREKAGRYQNETCSATRVSECRDVVPRLSVRSTRPNKPHLEPRGSLPVDRTPNRKTIKLRERLPHHSGVPALWR
jgi:hypothetical protein